MDPIPMLVKRLADLQNEVNAIREDMRELTDSIKTLSDDMYDVQADLTLVHNIEGYEDWRKEIGKPVSKPTDIVK
jgi:prefoldin subunit 5